MTSLIYKQDATIIGDLTYTYDAAGNRIKTGGSFARSGLPPALTTTSYNANNQQTTFGTNTLTYDLNGNLATVTDAGVTTTYSWNVRNQLTGISASGFAASFTYDSLGRRTGRTVQGVVTNYVYDGLNPVQEKAGATVTANLLTGLGIDEFFTRTDGVGSRALLPDALGSTVALGDGAGTLQTQYTYETFGYATQTGQANSNSYKYTGREDDGTGLDYYRARYYHPRLQRFISEDPIGFAGGDTNLYAYTFENPLRFRDPAGKNALLISPLVLSPPALLATAVVIGGVAVYYYYQQQSQVASPYDYLIYSKPNRSAKPKNCPSGTKPIDQYPGLDTDDIHKIKKDIARPGDWVGITPDGDVIIGGEGGEATNVGPYKDRLPWNK